MKIQIDAPLVDFVGAPILVPNEHEMGPTVARELAEAFDLDLKAVEDVYNRIVFERKHLLVGDICAAVLQRPVKGDENNSTEDYKLLWNLGRKVGRPVDGIVRLTVDEAKKLQERIAKLAYNPQIGGQLIQILDGDDDEDDELEGRLADKDNGNGETESEAHEESHGSGNGKTAKREKKNGKKRK